MSFLNSVFVVSPTMVRLMVSKICAASSRQDIASLFALLKALKVQIPRICRRSWTPPGLWKISNRTMASCVPNIVMIISWTTRPPRSCRVSIMDSINIWITPWVGRLVRNPGLLRCKPPARGPGTRLAAQNSGRRFNSGP